MWEPAPSIDPDEHLRCREVGTADDWAQVTREFFSTPVRTDRPPWDMLLVRENDADRVSVLVKMHHALGDGVAVTNTLLHLIRDVDEYEPPTRPNSRRAAGRPPIGQVARGLLSLATAGTAPRTGVTARSSRQRWFGWVQLPSAEVRAAARAHGVSSSVLLLAVVAEALHRALDDVTGTKPGQRFRVMVPRRAPNADNGAMIGNHTVALAVDLPVGPMSPADRVTEVTKRIAAAQDHGQPAATDLVMAALGVLPAPLHAWVARRVYGRRFFSGIVSVMPGLRRTPHIAGAEVAGVLPVLPLADGVGLGIGAISWGEEVGFGVTVDPAVLSGADRLPDSLRDAFHRLRATPEALRSEPGNEAGHEQ